MQVYVGSYDRHVYAINPATAALKWSFTTTGPIQAPPVVGPDGTVYIGAGGTDVFAISRGGVRLWNFSTASPESAPPLFALSSAGMLIVGSGDPFTYALDVRTGALVWKTKVVSTANCLPCIGDDGTVYLGSSDGSGTVFALAGDTGTVKWRWTSGRGANFASAVIGSDTSWHPATIYIGSAEPYLFFIADV